jgi:23S rRNA maturation mini-RNase III
MTAAIIYMESELEEGKKPNTLLKMRGAASKNIKTKSQAPAAKYLELMLTDTKEPTPEKGRRGLRKTYAQNFDAEYNSFSE